MADVFFDNPPVTRGTAEEQLQALQAYMHMLSQKLNEAMNEISADQLEPESRTALKTAAKNAEVTEDNRQALKALIIKNAEIVKTEMDEYRAQLQQSIQAVSEMFGEYQEEISAEFTATAEGIRQTYNALETIVSTANNENKEYRTRMQSYIYSGILSNSPYKTGIAIGENVTNDDGTLNNNNKMATFTADRITFYLNNVELGYYEGNKFHIAKGEVSDSMKMGNFLWKVFSNGALGLMKE